MTALSCDEQNLIDDCNELIKYLVRNAGELVKEGYFKSIDSVQVEEKVANWDVVTEYDQKVEEYLLNGIKAKYPNHRFIAEESETTNQPLTDEPTWIIDPIDGTNNFVRRIPLISISVAFVIKKEICLGIIYNPILNEFYSTRLGDGAFLNDVPIHCSTVEKLEEACIGHEVSFIRVEKYRERNSKQVLKFASLAQGFRSFGAATISLSYVARGTLDGYQINELYSWDIAAATLLIREAGGYVCKPDGSPIDLNDPKLICGATEKLCQAMVAANKEALNC